MKNQFGKTRPHDSPYAIYQGDGGFEWRILKTYRSAQNEKKDKYGEALERKHYWKYLTLLLLLP